MRKYFMGNFTSGQPIHDFIRLITEHPAMSRVIAIPTPHTLADQVRACRKGDERAMHWLFRQLAPKMLGVCRRYLYRLDLAEEALSSGFARAFDNMGSLREDHRFEGWLRAIMVRECIDTLRREKRYLFQEDPLDLPEAAAPASVEHQMATADLLELIDGLPAGYRTVFNLYAVEGYSHPEIAQLLGISENTSKSQYKKAREAIQSRMVATDTKATSYGSC